MTYLYFYLSFTTSRFPHVDQSAVRIPRVEGLYSEPCCSRGSRSNVGVIDWEG